MASPSRTRAAILLGVTSCLQKQVRWVFVTWTVQPICAMTRHFDFQWLPAFCILQHPLTVPRRDGFGLARNRLRWFRVIDSALAPASVLD
jgi:hypothetical protein